MYCKIVRGCPQICYAAVQANLTRRSEQFCQFRQPFLRGRRYQQIFRRIQEYLTTGCFFHVSDCRSQAFAGNVLPLGVQGEGRVTLKLGDFAFDVTFTVGE